MLGDLFKSGTNPGKESAELAKSALKFYRGIEPMTAEEVQFFAPELAGKIDAEQLSPTDLAKIQEDPQFQARIQQTLAELDQEAMEGLSPVDRMQVEDIMTQASAQAKSANAAIDQEMARRGISDSGLAFAGKRQNVQSVQNQARRDAMEKLKMARENSRAARREGTALASAQDQQRYQRLSNAATAQDFINRANAAARQGANTQNLAALQANLNTRANIRNMNAQQRNLVRQQNFENQMALANARSGVTQNASQMVGAQPAQPSGFQNLLQTGATIAGIGGKQGFGFWGAEDGGITPQSSGGVPVDQKALIAHQKQEAKFKRDYMKKIHNELLGNDNPNGQVVRAENGLLVPSMDDLSSSMLGGMEVRDNYVEAPEEKTMTRAAMKAPIKKPSVDPKLAELRKAQGEHDELLELRKAQGEHDKVLKAEKDKESAKKTKRALKGISKLNELLGFQEQERELPKLQKIDPEVKNILSEYKPMDFGNPFAQAAKDGTNPFAQAAEDGAVMDPVADIIGKAMARKQMAEGGSEEAKMMDMIRSMEEVPAMQDGGTYQAQDGSLLFTSDGSGDIVEGDSYERDRVDARLNSGEMVLNAAQQQRLMDMLRGEISLDELGDDDIVEGVPREYQEDIINGDDDRDIQAKGMNRLLDMLGRK